jgi:Tol biopolymer transport system component
MAGMSNPQSTDNVFLYSRLTGTSVLVSHSTLPGLAGNASSGEPLGPVVSADGSAVAYASEASDLLASGGTPTTIGQVYLWRQGSNTNVLVSHAHGQLTTPADNNSGSPAISADGSRIVFSSGAHDLLPTFTLAANHVYLYDPSFGTSVLISHGSSGPAAEATISSDTPMLSGDGAWVAFSTQGDNIDGGEADRNGQPDVALYSVATTANRWVSLRDPTLPRVAGLQMSAVTSMSADGVWVALESRATDLVPGETTNPSFPGPQVYLENRLTGSILLLSHSRTSPTAAGDLPSAQPEISRDGAYIAFLSSASDLIAGQVGNQGNVFLYDRVAGSTILVSRSAGSLTTGGNDASGLPAIDGDGSAVAYWSNATDLIPGQVASGFLNVFVFDRLAGTTTLVSHAAGSPTSGADAAPGPASALQISVDGRYIVFLSPATNLISGFLGASGVDSLYLYDRVTATTTLVSHASGSATTAADAAVFDFQIDAAGRFVAFSAAASNLVAGQGSSNEFQTFLFDRTTGVVTLVSHAAGSPLAPGNDLSFISSISADGNTLALVSLAYDLVPGVPQGENVNPAPTQVYLYDRRTDSMLLVSHKSGQPHTPATVFCGNSLVSADGSRVTFTTEEPALLPGLSGCGTTPTFDVLNVYVYDRATDGLQLASHAPGAATTCGNGQSGPSAISADGTFVAITSSASNLAAGDFNGAEDAFLYTADLPGRAFFTLPPCRLLDTRQSGQGPALVSGSKRVLAVHGVCGIPATARAIAVNLAVTQATAGGHLTLYPGDGSLPLASTLNFSAGQTRTNNAILPLDLSGDGTVALSPFVQGSGTVHLIVDVSGWFE